nr:hypothetical protein [Salinibacter ruber]
MFGVPLRPEATSVPDVEALFLQIDILPLESDKLAAAEASSYGRADHLMESFEIGDASDSVPDLQNVVLDG